MFREDSFCMFSFVLDLKNQKTQPASACNYALASNNTFMLRCIAYCQGSETCKGIHTFLSVLNMDSACFRIIHGFTRTQNLNANLFLSFLLFFPLRVELAPDEPELFFISRPRPSGHVRNGHAATSRGEE